MQAVFPGPRKPVMHTMIHSTRRHCAICCQRALGRSNSAQNGRRGRCSGNLIVIENPPDDQTEDVQMRFSCEACEMPLCREGDCWKKWHSNCTVRRMQVMVLCWWGAYQALGQALIFVAGDILFLSKCSMIHN